MIIRMVSPEEFHEAFSRPTLPMHVTRHFAGYSDDTLEPLMGVCATFMQGKWCVSPQGLLYSSSCGLEDIHDFISELTDYMGAPITIKLHPTYRDPKLMPCITAVFAKYAAESTLDIHYLIYLGAQPLHTRPGIQPLLREAEASGLSVMASQLRAREIGAEEMLEMGVTMTPEDTDTWHRLTAAKDGHTELTAYIHSATPSVCALTSLPQPTGPKSAAHLLLIAEAAKLAAATGHNTLYLGQGTVGGIPRAHFCALMEQIGATPSLSLTATFEK